MPRDTQILRSAPHAAPKDYEIDKNVELILRSVHAQFTDNGAGGDWLPCVDLISDSGHTIARCVDPNVKVTAGDDAEVTWFPDVKPSGGGATSTALAIAKGFLDGIVLGGDPFQTVPAGSNVNGQFPHASTTDAAVMDWRTSSVTNDTLDLKAVGTYLVYVTTHFDIVSLSLASISLNAGQDGFPHTPWEPEKSPRFGDNIGTADNMDMNVLHVTTPTHSINVTHSNRLGADHSVEQCYFTVVYLGTG